MYRKITRDVKIAAIKLFERYWLDLDAILDICNFSQSTWYRTLKLWQETGDVVKAGNPIHRSRVLNYDDIQYLKRLIHVNPDFFLDELPTLLQHNRFISIHYTTVHRELIRAGISRKKLQKIASERDENCRAEFIARISQYAPEELGFLDELSKDERTLARRFGRAKKGKRARKRGPFVRGRRTSTEAMLTINGIEAAMVVEGSMTTALFLEFLEYHIVRTIYFFTILHSSKMCVDSYQSVRHIRGL